MAMDVYDTLGGQSKTYKTNLAIHGFYALTHYQKNLKKFMYKQLKFKKFW